MQRYVKKVEKTSISISIFPNQRIFINIWLYVIEAILFNKYNDITDKLMDNTNDIQKRPRKDVSGCHNPFWSHRHSEYSKNLMKAKAQERAKQYQKWKDSNKPLTMDEFLSNNPSVKEYIKVLANSIIKEEIDKLIWRKQNQRVQIPNTWD